MQGLHDRVTTATALATGTEGPVRAALDRLRRYGIGERVIKSALAAGVAWWVAYTVHDDPLPLLAPITALFTIQYTLARSFLGSGQRLLGVVAGVAVALLLSNWFGTEWWVISLVVLISLTLGFRLFHLGSAGVEQMAVSALLVLIPGASENIVTVASYHILDVAIGTAVGLAANALIAPPSHVPGARTAVLSLGNQLTTLIEDLASALERGIDEAHVTGILTTARGLAHQLSEVQTALDHAEESLRFNLPGRLQRPGLDKYRRVNRSLEHAAIQTRVITRTVLDCVRTAGEPDARPSWLEADALGVPLGNLLHSVSDYLELFLALPENPEAAVRLPALRASIDLSRSEVNNIAAARFFQLLPDRWVLIGEIVSISDQLVADLTQAIAEVSGEVAPAGSDRSGQ
jgi:hypothetical protein